MLILPVEKGTVPDDCNHGEVRLVGGTYDYEGNVEICINGIWSTICDSGWGTSDAVVACTQAGFPGGGSKLNRVPLCISCVNPVLIWVYTSQVLLLVTTLTLVFMRGQCCWVTFLAVGLSHHCLTAALALHHLHVINMILLEWFVKVMLI